MESLACINRERHACALLCAPLCARSALHCATQIDVRLEREIKRRARYEMPLDTHPAPSSAMCARRPRPCSSLIGWGTPAQSYNNTQGTYIMPARDRATHEHPPNASQLLGNTRGIYLMPARDMGSWRTPIQCHLEPPSDRATPDWVSW